MSGYCIEAIKPKGYEFCLHHLRNRSGLQVPPELRAAVAKINYILRDYRTDEIEPIETRLLDLLYAIRMKLQAGRPFHPISGYRSPETNAFVDCCGRGTASVRGESVTGKA